MKTGTSKDMRDNWAVGWSAKYTVGVWVGNAGGAAMHDVSGTSGAAPVWAAMMRALHPRGDSRAPSPPAGLVRQPVKFGGALEAARAEWFLPGTQQAVLAVEADQTAPTARITSPADGTIVALDPDIPPARQRLVFTAAGPGALRWKVDGKPFAAGTRAAWLPWPGRHEVELVDGSGRTLDRRRVEVRGAGVRKGG